MKDWKDLFYDALQFPGGADHNLYRHGYRISLRGMRDIVKGNLSKKGNLGRASAYCDKFIIKFIITVGKLTIFLLLVLIQMY